MNYTIESSPLNILSSRERVDIFEVLFDEVNMYCEARNNFNDKWSSILPNFRIIPNCPDSHLVYRSPSPHSLLGQDLEKFLLLNIRTIIDLRHGTEKEEKPSSLLNYYCMQEYDQENDCFKLISKPQSINNSEEKSIFNIDFYSMNLLCKMFSSKELDELGENDPLKLLAMHAHKRGNLSSLYKDYLDGEIGVMRSIFKILSHDNPREIYPVLIHCSLGKDRTGVVSALIQHCFGHTRANIIEEYSLTHKYMEGARDRLLIISKKYGLPEEFINASKETMERFLEHIDNKYGGISKYFRQNEIEEISV